MTDNLISYIESLGVSRLGFFGAKSVVPNNWKELEYGISFSIKLSEPIVDDIKKGPSKTYFAHYRSVNYHINEVSLKIVLYLQKMGFKAVPIPASQTVSEKNEISGVFQHRTAATLSGLGWVGKSGMFIDEKLGPSVRLGTIFTNMKLSSSSPIRSGRCGSCRICVESCPAMAIEGKEWKAGMERNELYDARACSDYMKEAFKDIGRGVVCGICMSICPKNHTGNK
jgi:epoxyqueuosine reductase QueG